MSLRMRQGVSWVDVPEEYLPDLPPAGVPAEYKFTETFVDFQPSQVGTVPIKKSRWKEEVAFSATWKIRIKNQVIELGLVSAWDAQGNPERNSMGMLSFKPNANGGKLYLHPDLDDDQLEKFYALELHPEVGGNKLDELTGKQKTDAGKMDRPIMRIDSDAEAAAERAETAIQMKAQGHAIGLKSKENVEQTALVLGIGTAGQSLNQVRAAVERAAKQNPADYLLRVNDANLEMRAEFLHALHSNIIFVDRETSTLRFTGNKGEIIPLTSLEEQEVGDQYITFVKENKSGPSAHKMVQNFVKAHAK